MKSVSNFLTITLVHGYVTSLAITINKGIFSPTTFVSTNTTTSNHFTYVFSGHSVQRIVMMNILLVERRTGVINAAAVHNFFWSQATFFLVFWDHLRVRRVKFHSHKAAMLFTNLVVGLFMISFLGSGAAHNFENFKVLETHEIYKSTHTKSQKSAAYTHRSSRLFNINFWVFPDTKEPKIYQKRQNTICKAWKS